jgi:hypothetical protein
MTLILVSTAVFLLAALVRTLGVVLGRHPLTGSCGTDACGPCDACPRRRRQALREEVPP